MSYSTTVTPPLGSDPGTPDELISKGSVLTDIRFVEAIRPRNNVVIKPCDNCLQMFKYNFNSKSIPVNTPEIYFVPVSRLVDDE